jgi:hypothetical protein
MISAPLGAETSFMLFTTQLVSIGVLLGAETRNATG